MNIKHLFIVIMLAGASRLQAQSQFVRWTEADDQNGNLEHVIQVLNQRTGLNLTVADFTSVEERDLATSHFRMLAQTVGGVPVDGAALRIWTRLNTGELIQAEAKVQTTRRLEQLAAQPPANPISMQEANRLVAAVVATHQDSKPFQLVKSQRVWKNDELAQLVKVKTRRGHHTVTVSIANKKVVEHRYDEFPQSEYTVRANLYPIYEEAETAGGQILEREPLELRYVKSQMRRATGVEDPYAALRTDANGRPKRYFENRFDPVRGATTEGQAQGYWSMAVVKQQATDIRDAYPLADNSLESGRAFLEGRYATINIHPAAAERFTGLNFALTRSLQFRPDWVLATDQGVPAYEMIPGGSLLGKPMESAAEVAARAARRLPNHDPVAYLNDGFDELQVYYSVNKFMESLQSMGMTDPELSTRPFHAYLYDPDISMRDNAYYTGDTINFTTYSPNAPNYARDNSTIWHELGHGIMDRLMGDSIVLADTGGLSEGMADFLAALVIADAMEGRTYPGMNDYRIINRTGFHLTNEVHDDGEAYGGAMGDLKDAAMARDQRQGLIKVTDLTMEAMRLTRNHPGLTAADWFEHMLFADSRGSAVRQAGEMRELILTALNGRNFSLDSNVRLASFSMKNAAQEVNSGTPGSRQAPVAVSLRANENKVFNLAFKLEDGQNYRFEYPVSVKVFFRSGPLQGAVRWEGEEAEPRIVTINRPGETVQLPVRVMGQCDAVNREDGSCVDYAYVQIWNGNTAATKPVAKKRFYVQVRPKAN